MHVLILLDSNQSFTIMKLFATRTLKFLTSNCWSTHLCHQHNPHVMLIRHASTRKRFYKNVSVVRNIGPEGLWEVNLDARKLKTPGGKLFQVGSQKLALAIAAEWDAQKEKIDLTNMHLTSLAYTVLDNPCKDTPQSISEHLIGYLDSDTICYRDDDPEELDRLQSELWDPIIDWFNEKYNCRIEPIRQGLVVPSEVIPSEVASEVKRQLESYSLWSLQGIKFATENLKSLMITLALLDNKFSVNEAVALSRLEVEFQIGRWGRVEWAHDVDQLALQSRVAAGLLLHQFTCENNKIENIRQAA